MRVKFCGLRTAQDVKQAAELDCDAVGFVFVDGSKRHVTLEQAQPLIALAKNLGVLTVALVANTKASEITAIIEHCQPDVVQFHGFEDARFCEQFKHRYWKAIPMLNELEWQVVMNSHKNAELFLLDNYGEHQSGGSGQTFDWFRFPAAESPRMILAGGLNATNLDQAIAITGAEFIDISSGIEVTPGVKSHAKMQQIMHILTNLKQP